MEDDKKPSFQFYPGDWKKDPALSMCAPATRGIWMDMLCAIHDLRSTGVLTGTVEQLSRLCRCQSGEMADAIADLQATKTAEISERSGVYSIVSRRAKRQVLVSQERSDAGKHGADARWGKNSKPYGKPIANAMAKGMAKNGSSSSSSSSEYVTERSDPETPRSVETLGEEGFAGYLGNKLKPKDSKDCQFLLLVSRAIKERRFAESLVQFALAGCDGKDVKRPIGMFRAALRENVKAAGGDLELILDSMKTQGGNDGSGE